MRQCSWCNQYLPDEQHNTQYRVEILRGCNAPDGDGHLWRTVSLDEFKLNYTWHALSLLPAHHIQQLKVVLGEFLDTPREQDAKMLRQLILEYEGQHYGW